MTTIYKRQAGKIDTMYYKDFKNFQRKNHLFIRQTEQYITDNPDSNLLDTARIRIKMSRELESELLNKYPNYK